MDKVQNPSHLSVINLRQNPLDSTSHECLFFNVVTVSFHLFHRFNKFKLSYMVAFLYKWYDVLQTCFCSSLWPSIFPYGTFDNDTIFISVRSPWCASVLLCIIIQGHLAILEFVAPHENTHTHTHTHFLSAENVLALNTQWSAMNLPPCAWNKLNNEWTSSLEMFSITSAILLSCKA
jgi:hypothetical protein